MVKQKTRWEKIRKFFNDVHLWLGLSSGLILVLICFSGTVYVFNEELSEMATPHLYTVEAGAKRLPAEQFIATVEAHSGGKLSSVKIPDNPRSSYQYSVKMPGDNSRGGTAYMVNPYTGEILGNSKEPNGVKDFMRDMFSLHRWLLLDKIEEPLLSGYTNRELGSMISGWATIIFTLGCLTGFIIWFPKKIRNWKQGLKVKFSSNWKRLNHDLHNTLAFYSLIFLLIMGLTGPQWSFQWYRDGLQKSLGTYQPKDAPKPKGPKSAKPADGNFQIASISGLLAQADEQLPYKGDYVLTIPADSSSALVVNKYKTGFFAPAAPNRLSFDQFSGALLKTDIFSDKPFNERVAGSIKALHIGTVYGTFTKIIYFITCLIATSLPITGTLIWWNKLKKKKRTKPKPVAVPARELVNA